MRLSWSSRSPASTPAAVARACGSAPRATATLIIPRMTPAATLGSVTAATWDHAFGIRDHVLRCVAEIILQNTTAKEEYHATRGDGNCGRGSALRATGFGRHRVRLVGLRQPRRPDRTGPERPSGHARP